MYLYFFRDPRVCRAGAGVEKTPGKGDTPGFTPRDKPIIIDDPRGHKRIEMKRINRYINQSSLVQALSWRGNCDVQFLIYESDPDDPDINEISKCTDYVVGYISKALETLSIEKKKLKEMILQMSVGEEYTDDPSFAKTIARKILNTYASQRVISKQECMVMLLGLKLVSCTESFEKISLSGGYKLTKDKKFSGGNPMIQQYAKRPAQIAHKSLDQFISDILKNREATEKEIVRHYIGTNIYPVYPVTAGYARSILMIHKPWTKQPFIDETDDEIIEMFNQFYESDACPMSVKINYQRQKQRYDEERLHHEPVAKDIEVLDLNTFSLSKDVTQDDIDAVLLASTLPTISQDEDLNGFYLGKENYDWSIKHQLLTPFDSSVPINKWLSTMIENEKSSLSQQNVSALELPERVIISSEGNLIRSGYDIGQCRNDQKNIILFALMHLKNYVLQQSGEASFVPFRLTIQGCAGSGKSTLIKTLVTCFKRVFKNNNSVVVCGPTGSAAFNAGGETCHHTFAVPCCEVDTPESLKMSAEKLKSMLVRLKHMKVLIIDERSMIASELLAIVEQRCRQLKDGSTLQDVPWGNLPFIFLVGDDFQLPSVKNGAFYIGQNVKKNHMNIIGDELFLSLANNVMELESSKRQCESEQVLLRLLRNARMEDEKSFISYDDAQFLCKYNLGDLRQFSEEEAKKIKDDPGTLLLFAYNEPKDEANRKKLFQTHNFLNPVAIFKPKGMDKGKPKRKPKHFIDKEIPEILKVCRGAKVQILYRNLHPPWGLYNGAMGIVKDIVFAEGENPNNEDYASYILVDFPQYCGPAYDKNFPTYVPITPVTKTCKFQCCTLQYFPLSLCFAKTVHTFQGASVGPVPVGYTPNPVQKIICYPGVRQFEGNNPGLLYTILSRVTTLGDLQDKLSSCLFFDGPDINAERFVNLNLTADGKTYKKILLREEWTQKLKENLVKSTEHLEKEQEIIDWYENFVNN